MMMMMMMMMMGGLVSFFFPYSITPLSLPLSRFISPSMFYTHDATTTTTRICFSRFAQ
jgi:hypothetical protein